MNKCWKTKSEFIIKRELDVNYLNEKRKQLAKESLSKVSRTIDALRKNGLEPGIVSCAGTGTYNITAGYPGVTEIQPGSYIMMDRRYHEIETCGSDFEQAMYILASVVSNTYPAQVVLDLGWKGCGIEYEALGWGGMPAAVGFEETEYHPGGDEHGVLKFKDPCKRPNVGEKIKLIPSHCDTTLNLHGRFYGIRGDEVEVVC